MIFLDQSHGRSSSTTRGVWLALLASCSLLLAACGGAAESAVGGRPHETITTLSSGKVVSRPTYPLTGLAAPNLAAARRPSLAVKIDNVYGAWPQAGLNRADIVFDILVEGGLTRLMAVYQSHGAPVVGPIRSARPVDAYLLRLFHGGYFAFSGASRGEMKPVKGFSHATLLDETMDAAPFYRRSDHPEPDNLFSSTHKLYAALHKRAPHKAGPPQVFAYRDHAPKGVPTRRAVVPFPAAKAAWRWNGHQYLRRQDGNPDKLVNGSRISATNVVVMSVKIVGTGIFETNGAQDPLPVTVGSGKCWILRSGVRVDGTWHRAKISDPLRFIDAHHHVIGLAPGRTWVELMPRSESPSFHK